MERNENTLDRNFTRDARDIQSSMIRREVEQLARSNVYSALWKRGQHDSHNFEVSILRSYRASTLRLFAALACATSRKYSTNQDYIFFRETLSF